MKPLSFTVEGCPIPFQRTCQGKSGARFTPPKTRAWRNHVGLVAALSAGLAGWPQPHDCMRVTAPTVPSSRRCKCRWCYAQYALTVHAHFPDRRTRDLDNVAKSILDALTGIGYRDDGQVCELHVYRHLDKDHPRADVTLELRS